LSRRFAAGGRLVASSAPIRWNPRGADGHWRATGAHVSHDAEQAQVAYQHAIRRLHASGGSMREIADALGLSYQRVHQIVDVSTGKGAIRPSAIASLSCAFCGLKGNEALIGGPGVHICDRCVDLADDVVAEGGQRTNERTLLVALDLGNPKARCSFCGKKRDQVGAMAHAPLRTGQG
jgi:hypothetical protein